MTVHKDRCVGSGITLDAGMPREEAACRAKCVNSLRRGIWCERKWILATGIPCVRGCKRGAKTLRPWTSVIAYSSSLTLSLEVSSLSRGKVEGSYLRPNVGVDLQEKMKKKTQFDEQLLTLAAMLHEAQALLSQPHLH